MHFAILECDLMRERPGTSGSNNGDMQRRTDMNNRWSGIKVLCALMLIAGSRLAFAAAGDPIYVGAEKCKNCHSSPKKGDPFGKWAASFHSKAFTELASEEAKK